MPIYKYEVLVDLPGLDEAKSTIHLIHAAVCGGTTEVDEEGNTTHTCGREWQASVHGFTAIRFDEPESDGKVEVDWENEVPELTEAPNGD